MNIKLIAKLPQNIWRLVRTPFRSSARFNHTLIYLEKSLLNLFNVLECFGLNKILASAEFSFFSSPIPVLPQRGKQRIFNFEEVQNFSLRSFVNEKMAHKYISLVLFLKIRNVRLFVNKGGGGRVVLGRRTD